jgi:mannose-6-phosphate isomerase class I
MQEAHILHEKLHLHNITAAHYKYISICGFRNNREYNKIESPISNSAGKTNITEIKYQIHKEILHKFNLKCRKVKSAFHCIK